MCFAGSSNSISKKRYIKTAKEVFDGGCDCGNLLGIIYGQQ